MKKLFVMKKVVSLVVLCLVSNNAFVPSNIVTPSSTKQSRTSGHRLIQLHESKVNFKLNEEEVRRAFQMSCRNGNVIEARNLLQRCIYYYFQNYQNANVSNTNKNNNSEKIIIVRDVHDLINACTLPKKTSDYKLKMANRLLLLHHHLGSTHRQNAIGLSMILRACTSLRQVNMVKHIYFTVFCFSKQTKSPIMIFQKDIILCNGMLDSLLSCHLQTEAYHLLYDMLTTATTSEQQDPTTIAFILHFFIGVSKETAIELASSLADNKNNNNSNNNSNDRTNNNQESQHQQLLPRPNQRTFNIFLKGLTLQLKLSHNNSETWGKIHILSQYMKRINMWDAITTNTLVNAHVSCEKFEDAEQLLLLQTSDTQKDDHPNIQAYTELYVGYAKHNYEKAKRVLHTMKSRGVRPNLFTYTAMLQAMSRNGEYQQMKSLLKQLLVANNNNNNINELYNAIFTGLLLDYTPSSTDDEDDYATRIQCAIQLFNGLFNNNSTIITETATSTTTCIITQPNNVIILSSILFQGLARYCLKKNKELAAALRSDGRYNSSNNAEQRHHQKQQHILRSYVKVSSKIYQQLLQLGYIIPNTNSSKYHHGNLRIHTPLMTIYASVQDLPKVKSCFLSIERKDTKALNSYLDACIKCNSLLDSLKAFQQYVVTCDDGVINSKPNNNNNEMNNNPIRPDVVTYTILITSILKSAATKTQENTKYFQSSLFNDDDASTTTNVKNTDGTNMLSNPQSSIAMVTKRAQLLYDDMLLQWNITPDKALTDCIVNTMCSRPFFDTYLALQSSTTTSTSASTSAYDENSKTRVEVLKFLKQVLLDAQKYNCYYDDEDDERQTQLQNEYEILVNKVQKCVQIEKALRKKQMEQLFRNKGWNEVDSSFRIFGDTTIHNTANSSKNSRTGNTGNKWLDSKGWDDFDSGFRII